MKMDDYTDPDCRAAVRRYHRDRSRFRANLAVLAIAGLGWISLATAIYVLSRWGIEGYGQPGVDKFGPVVFCCMAILFGGMFLSFWTEIRSKAVSRSHLAMQNSLEHFHTVNDKRIERQAQQAALELERAERLVTDYVIQPDPDYVAHVERKVRKVRK